VCVVSTSGANFGLVSAVRIQGQAASPDVGLSVEARVLRAVVRWCRDRKGPMRFWCREGVQKDVRVAGRGLAALLMMGIHLA
jgi:hypothetical protein